ncbi:hypothetical protein SteCoe_1420 [Stentor coeruleus]|uniref:EF-hand domain-containing protein n=1 Tax=Stentor coeruleus TaxID=5963 RepID=A0A1R2D1S3_9CILI|nr:hypothetical protein SteCoe_1420 [Stentor coeruleus]
MSSSEIVTIDKPQYFKDFMSIAGAWYTKAKTNHPTIGSGFNMVEPFINPVANAFTYYAEPVFTKIDTRVSKIIRISAEKLEEVDLTFNEKKAFYKASMRAWISHNHKNFSEFLESLKSYYPSKWKESIETYALDFYNKSLNYKKPSEMLSLAADLLSEGSDNLRGSMQNVWKSTKKAWKKNKIIKVSEHFTKLKEQVGDLWSDKIKENATIFLSLLKLKEKILLNSSLSENWKSQASSIAESTSILILAGADELYFWSRATFDKNYPIIYSTLSVYVPFKITLKNIYNRLSEMDTEQLGSLTWPEDVKQKITPAIKKVGLEAWTNKYWAKIDKDEDGVVTFRDVYAVFIVVSTNTYGTLKQTMNQLAGRFVRNGEITQE